ncbi:hypothetical protein ABZ896_12480 [Streptomyces sp. NPDC047072]|uniref:hypothetical protein n=1 Tax=Streptomyces sp. NPDC047072 TaxID=3154809 RepID=UPI00340271DD
MNEPRSPATADIEPLIEWDIPPLDAVPAGDRPFVVAYYAAIAGILDCFDGIDEQPLADQAIPGTEGRLKPAAAVDSFVRAHLDILDTWYQAIDSLDGCARGDAGLPHWAEQFLRGEAEDLFRATSALDCAVMTHHHGSAGPRLSASYGFAYPLSNGVIHPSSSPNRS